MMLADALGERVFLACGRSIRDLESRAVLGPRPAVVIDARGGDVRMPKPLLHLREVGLAGVSYRWGSIVGLLSFVFTLLMGAVVASH